MNRRSFLRAAAGVAAAFGLGPAVKVAERVKAGVLPSTDGSLTLTFVPDLQAEAAKPTEAIIKVPVPPGRYVQTWDVWDRDGDTARVTVHYGDKPLCRSGPGYYDVARYHREKLYNHHAYIDGRDVTGECDELNIDEGWARLYHVADRHHDGTVKRLWSSRERFIAWGKIEMRLPSG